MLPTARFVEFGCPNDHNRVIVAGGFAIDQSLRAGGFVSAAHADGVEFVDVLVFQGHNALTQHQETAAEHAENIQNSPAKGDWKSLFKAEADQIKSHLESARESLAQLMHKVRASEKRKLTPELEAVQQRQAKAEEHLRALQEELAKPKPNREAAQKDAAAVHDELIKAEQANQKLRSAHSTPVSRPGA